MYLYIIADFIFVIFYEWYLILYLPTHTGWFRIVQENIPKNKLKIWWMYTAEDPTNKPTLIISSHWGWFQTASFSTQANYTHNLRLAKHIALVQENISINNTAYDPTWLKLYISNTYSVITHIQYKIFFFNKKEGLHASKYVTFIKINECVIFSDTSPYSPPFHAT